MDAYFDNLLDGKGTAKTLKEYEDIVKQSGTMWKKPFEYNTPIAGNLNFDDFFKVVTLKDAKLWKVTIKCFERPDGSIEYLRGIQFFYKGSDGRTAEGYDQTNPACLSKGKMKAMSFELDDDEYPIAIIGRTGLFIDKFGFRTTKDREFSFGGEGGGPRELKAPKGLFFNRFGSVHCPDGVFSILCESSIIPESNQQVVANKSSGINLEFLGNSIRFVFDCLSLKEIFTLFKLNRYFAAQRHSPVFLNRLAKRIIYSCDIQSRNYIDEIMKSANTSIRSVQTIQKLLQITENKIPNPFGDKEFEGFTITQSGGSGIIIIHSNTQNYRTSAFQTSFSTGEIMYQAKLADIFDSEFLKMLENGTACIVAGCYMKNPGFGAKGHMKLVIRDDHANKDVLNETVQDKNLPKEWKPFFIKYQKDLLSDSAAKLTPTSVKLFVGGSDNVYWAGTYGNIISGILLRGLPFFSRQDKVFLTI